MKVEVALLGSYRDKRGPNEVMLEFQTSPTLRRVVSRSLTHFREIGKDVDEHYMMVAAQGKVVPVSAWDATIIADGQRCTIFPPLQGG